ncbi:5'-AMP-activated protein kinase, beta subunit, complex-interacting region [Dictyocaulus viviparus]|uniref:5'-AMP-activated protein kinase subunit beta-1 n=1 Tax=Dictyocaulus viviparus TaxID=29172 RepID=A0A0D8XU64_DICVI|nr:5'-AMP-activated protein kinase, beta subunit, complex-interacting region [Dictyocaulus viviparus]
MGNNQPTGFNKRDRSGEGNTGGMTTPGRSRAFCGNPQSISNPEDGCPVQVKIAKSDDDTEDSIAPTVQFKETNEYPVVFKWHCSATSQPRSVFICGSWDGWRHKIPLVKSDNDFSTILELTPGHHEYKFMVDNKWVVDNNQPKTNNNLGGENNVMSIDEDDFEVFDALDKDLASSNAGEAMRGAHSHQPSHDTPNDRELEKLRTFSQDIPERSEFAKAHNPPALPPHLLQVILNKDTPVQCDPNVLPEPNHVMLNHLYALSIKDGVMVLSATHRYRKKYVTTLLYKPI